MWIPGYQISMLLNKVKNKAKTLLISQYTCIKEFNLERKLHTQAIITKRKKSCVKKNLEQFGGRH